MLVSQALRDYCVLLGCRIKRALVALLANDTTLRMGSWDP